MFHDGLGVATWWLDRDRSGGRTTLVVDYVVPLTRPAMAAIEAEGLWLLGFLDTAGTDHDVRFAAVD